MAGLDRSVRNSILANRQTLSHSERKVAEYVLAHPLEVLRMSLLEIAIASDVSDATVVRFIRAIGFENLNEMKITLAADTAHPAEEIFNQITDDSDSKGIIQQIFFSNIRLLQDTLQTLKTESILKALDIINSSASLSVYAVGSSAPLAGIFFNRLFRLGYRVNAVTDAYEQLMQASILKNTDCVIGISRTGTPLTLVEAVRQAKMSGARVVAITGNPASPLAEAADVTLTCATRDLHPDLYESPVALMTIIDVIYTGLEIHDRANTSRNQMKIWNALSKMHMPAGDNDIG